MGTTDAEILQSAKTALKNLLDTPIKQLQASDREAHFIEIDKLKALIDEYESEANTQTSEQMGVRFHKFRYGDCS
jgi:hypothetical protein